MRIWRADGIPGLNLGWAVTEVEPGKPDRPVARDLRREDAIDIAGGLDIRRSAEELLRAMETGSNPAPARKSLLEALAKVR